MGLVDVGKTSINKGFFTSWTMKLSHVRGHFPVVTLHGNTSMVRFPKNAFLKFSGALN